VPIVNKWLRKLEQRKKIKIKGLRYSVIITRTHIICHDRKETHETWRNINPHSKTDIKSPNARYWWLEYREGILAIAEQFSGRLTNELTRW
jgi:hypothetical protein